MLSYLRYLCIALGIVFLPCMAQTCPQGQAPWTVGGITYVWCADENGTCTLTGTNSVLFGNDDGGVDNGHTISSFSGNANCYVGPGGFSTDPAYGYDKHCWVASAPAPVMTLTTSATSISLRQAVTITVAASYATSCSGVVGLNIGGSGGVDDIGGSVTFSPTATATYTETCTNSSGSVSASVTVAVS